MTSVDQPLLDTVDPEITAQMVRRTALRRGAAGLLAAASGSVGLAFMARDAFAQELPAGVADVLNFALTLEFLEADYYRQGLDASNLIPDRDRTIFETLREHEDAHVEFLQEALGDRATEKPQFDFTAGGAFAPFEDYETFRLLSIAFEDTGVRAYKGQAIVQAARPLLDNPQLLTQALTIHSVEARHAARVRQLLGFSAWVPGNFSDAPDPVRPVYATDGSLGDAFDVTATTLFGVDLTSVTDQSDELITESFDEPLGMKAVLGIANMFIR